MMDFLGNCTVFHSSTNGEARVEGIGFVVVKGFKEYDSKVFVFSAGEVQLR